jgi:GT2 family glycosyltransferase
MSRVSVVVLAYNRASELMHTLARLRELPEQPPLIVVDNASTDATAALVRQVFPEVNLVRMPDNIGAAGRNAGVEAATTPYVAFCDDDTWWAPGSLARAVEILHVHPRLAALTAQVLVGPQCRVDPVSREMAASPLPRAGMPGPVLLGFLAGASVFRRAAFLDAGGYEPRLFIGAEEELLAYELAARGWSICYVDELHVHHHPSAVRDSSARARLLARNRLWIAWLRRPPQVALSQTLRAPVPSLLRALPGALWAWRERRVLPAHLEALRARLDADRAWRLATAAVTPDGVPRKRSKAA